MMSLGVCCCFVARDGAGARRTREQAPGPAPRRSGDLRLDSAGFSTSTPPSSSRGGRRNAPPRDLGDHATLLHGDYEHKE